MLSTNKRKPPAKTEGLLDRGPPSRPPKGARRAYSSVGGAGRDIRLQLRGASFLRAGLVPWGSPSEPAAETDSAHGIQCDSSAACDQRILQQPARGGGGAGRSPSVGVEWRPATPVMGWGTQVGSPGSPLSGRSVGKRFLNNRGSVQLSLRSDGSRPTR